MPNIFTAIKKHKIAVAIVLLILIGGGYYAYIKYNSGQAQISYVTAPVLRGTIVTSVSGSGQISAANQVDIKAKVSGDIIKVSATDGLEVKSGDIIAQINARDGYKTVRDASANLQNAQLSLDKLKQAADSYSIMQAENFLANSKASLEKLKLSQPVDYQSALEVKQKAEDALNKTHDDAFNAIFDAFVNFPIIMSGLDNILYGYGISLSETSVNAGQYNILALLNSSDVTDLVTDRSKIQLLQNSVEADYKIADTKYNDCLADYKDINRYFNNVDIENLLAKTTITAKTIAQAIKNTKSYLDTWVDFRTLRDRSVFAKVTEYQTNLITYSGQANSHLTNLQTIETTIKNNKNAIDAANNDLKLLTQNQPLDLAAAKASLKEKQLFLADLKAGADPLDIKSQELSLQQKRNALYDAQTALADYVVRAPFDGVVAQVNVKTGDPTLGAIIATIITRQTIAEISLNEIDAAKIKIGDKATLTFDAIDGLMVSGKVAEIDTLGAVSQGVVTYNVKIIFDSQDSQVKSGMSVDAAIITNIKTNVLTVPNSAVKGSFNGSNYVQILDAAGKPQNLAVVIGLANDTDTEITSGLNESDKVITKTIISGAANAAAQQSGAAGGLRIPGIGGGTGGNFRR